MTILVSNVIEKDGKYLLVQEAKKKCYGKWNLPSGHLEAGESIFEAAIREAREETNCDVELTALCRITNFVYHEDSAVAFTFIAKPLTFDIRPRKGEILDVKWFTYEEIIAMKSDLRHPELTIPDLDAARTAKEPFPLQSIGIITQNP